MKTGHIVWLVLAIIVGYFLYKTHRLDALLASVKPTATAQGA